MKTDPDCIFCKIVAGKIPCHKIYEDSSVLVILSIDPIVDGHSLVIPKEHHPKVWSIDDDHIYLNLMLVARRVAQALNTTFKPKHLIELAEGMDIAHAHLHLLPTEIGYGELAAKHVTKDPNHSRLSELAKKIQKAL